MALEINQRKLSGRSIGISLIGLIFIGAAGYLLYLTFQPRESSESQAPAYDYTIVQQVSNKISYMDNSFYGHSPAIVNNAYVANLTDVIDTTIHYGYSGSEDTDLTYTYNAKIQVRGTYAMKGDGEKLSNVWQKEYTIVSPVSKTVTGKKFAVDKTIQIPYAEYKAMIDQYKTTLAVPINGEAVLTFTLNVSGKVNGTRFSDKKVSTVTVPLDVQIYKLTVKYDKNTTKQVLDNRTIAEKDLIERNMTIIISVVGVIGLALVIYGFRKKIFKSPYRRELERIYRYYDGIIIKTSKQPDLSNKNVVQVQSFDDMVNLEEELKTPIVSSTTSDEATKFMIIKSDVVYVYLLGEPPVDPKDLEAVGKSLHGRWSRHK